MSILAAWVLRSPTAGYPLDSIPSLALARVRRFSQNEASEEQELADVCICGGASWRGEAEVCCDYKAPLCPRLARLARGGCHCHPARRPRPAALPANREGLSDTRRLARVPARGFHRPRRRNWSRSCGTASRSRNRGKPALGAGGGSPGLPRGGLVILSDREGWAAMTRG